MNDSYDGLSDMDRLRARIERPAPEPAFPPQDMTATQLASHWRAQAGRCLEAVDSDRQRILRGSFPLGEAPGETAGRIIKNTIQAETLVSCAEEMLRRLK